MILLTSRLQKVAKLMGTVDLIELEGLTEDEYWSFFKEQSFGGANPEEHPRLEAVGKKIASKLKGSPLAAKTMGALLNDKLDVDDWISKIWEVENGQDGIMSILRLCYLYLPAHLRQCFAYLSIFPKNWQFERDDVIRMWMAQGMIYHDKRTKRTEDVGNDYFNELISKSFFQPVNRYTDKYTIHDLLHYLAESVSKDDCFRIDGDEFRIIPTTIRHLYLHEKHLAKLKENKFVLERLRTLILCEKFSANPNYADLQDVIRQLRKIRLLALRRLHLQKCHDNLSRLIHLRYLDLSGNHEIKKLPDELTMLYHLQTLNLFQLGFDHKLESMNKLISLRSLICSSRVLSMVAEIGELSGLQQLSCPFYVQNVPGFDLPQLKGLNSLGGCLCIRYLENVQSEEQAREARLREKKNLVELDLHWGSAERNINPKVESGVLDGLEPPLNIEKLYINGYKGTRSPKWILPNFLVSVKLTSCSNWKELPALAECPRLEDLELSRMHAVHTFHSGGGGSNFPSLRKLTFDDLHKLKMWSTDGKSILFPRLETLRISGCPKLTEIPQLPTTVERLELFNVGLSKFPELPTKSWRFSVLSIKGCPDLRSPGEWLLDQHENLEHLTELTADPCGELDILLVKAINKLTGLKRLCIDSWPFEQILDDDDDDDEEEKEEKDVNYMEEDLKYEEEDCGLLLESLESLEIINCVVAGKILSNSLQGLPALQVLRIDWCSGPTILSSEEGLQKLTALNQLEVTNCRGFTSLVGLGALYSLQDLKVIDCPELIPLPSSGSCEFDMVEGEEGGLSALFTLCIDNTLLLKVLLSGQGLASLKELEIIFSDQTEIDEEVFLPLISLQSLRFEACHNLETLPPLKNLHSLKKLEIEDCSNFQSLPSKEGLPPSLTHLVVLECHPEFNKQYNMDDGPDWQTIRDIPCLHFD